MAYHHGNLRTELLARAEAVIATDGVDALSLRSLARDIGVSHAAPGRHFPDKQDLLDALAVEGFDRLGTQLKEAASKDAASEPTTEATSGSGAFTDRVIGTALAYVRFATDHPALLELMHARKHREPSADLRTASDACGVILLGLLADSDTEIGDPERFGVILLATLQGIAALTAGGALPPAHHPDDLVTDAVRRLLRGSTG
ncbi:TetR/AcrR family transcriptional regulator [Streptomyces sp. NPDC058001]|uniref:TetR/AcrR family transcriptional regulator n=1 Tax=Streptomyces sp. NPDC058001 TaxID=3346300 RepID=UPI0036ED036B